MSLSIFSARSLALTLVASVSAALLSGCAASADPATGGTSPETNVATGDAPAQVTAADTNDASWITRKYFPRQQVAPSMTGAKDDLVDEAPPSRVAPGAGVLENARVVTSCPVSASLEDGTCYAECPEGTTAAGSLCFEGCPLSHPDTRGPICMTLAPLAEATAEHLPITPETVPQGFGNGVMRAQ